MQQYLKNTNGIARVSRRQSLAILGGAGAALLTGSARAAGTCASLAAQQTEGPYWVEENLNRQDIRVDPSDGSVQAGTPLTLTLTLQEITGLDCAALAGARVDIWHCSASGLYSDEAAQRTTGKKYLRGYQVSGDDGVVQFTTVYPGWYSGRTVHIHVRVRTYSGSSQLDQFTAQLFFDDAVTDTAFTQAPYNARGARDTRNARDMVLTGTTGGAAIYLALAQTAAGYSGAATIGVNLKTPAASRPTIAAGGVVNAASYGGSVSAGSWVALFGQNLAQSARALASTDLVNGKLPSSLGGVSVTIDGQSAYVLYVSATQINVQAPVSLNSGAVAVQVTNSAGSSAMATVDLQGIAPGLFASAGAVSAVRSDGVVVDGSSVSAQPGDILEIYGTGFGATSPAVEPGTLFSGSAAATNPVTVVIGGQPALVSYAGLVGAGLYQLNVTVPALVSGSYPVVATVAGFSTQNGVSLKVQS